MKIVREEERGHRREILNVSKNRKYEAPTE
jgi:hypothetical protein